MLLSVEPPITSQIIKMHDNNGKSDEDVSDLWWVLEDLCIACHDDTFTAIVYILQAILFLMFAVFLSWILFLTWKKYVNDGA